MREEEPDRPFVTPPVKRQKSWREPDGYVICRKCEKSVEEAGKGKAGYHHRWSRFSSGNVPCRGSGRKGTPALRTVYSPLDPQLIYDLVPKATKEEKARAFMEVYCWIKNNLSPRQYADAMAWMGQTNATHHAELVLKNQLPGGVPWAKTSELAEGLRRLYFPMLGKRTPTLDWQRRVCEYLGKEHPRAIAEMERVVENERIGYERRKSGKSSWQL
ncbi:hypothetical protein OG948_59345 (plasmid) [Embleya sp. NBC_00888]|uniref:hypothetical protein n=1 Tax=Embleya sp. NBC_00888 TaxID=2975960 RepID=UPI002F9119AE|nr:hypothetical protein OG948_33975 [Embleya sp. NBC_00888]WSY48119.1 hypothetical protein OG948_59345 [Embleya sp. NBC_00888]